MSECEQFPEGTRIRSICEGTADLPLAKINAYRDRWGLDPFHGPDEARPPKVKIEAAVGRSDSKKESASASRESRRGKSGGCCGGDKTPAKIRLNGWGPGSQLLKLFEADGVPHCDDCILLAGQMDRWGKRGCDQRVELIVADMLPRAKAWLKEKHPWAERLLSMTFIEDEAVRVALRRKVHQAIANTPSPASKTKAWKPSGNWASAFRPSNGVPEFIPTSRLAEDTLKLIPQLPPDVSHIVGVSRSGLAPATLLAMTLHLPITILRHHQGDYVAGGNGWRLNGNRTTEGTILVVDDTTMTGNSLNRTKHVLRDMSGEKLFAAVYVNPSAIAKPDVWVHDLPWPHLLEWNLFNSVLLDSFAIDFDGILCHDCPPADDDDGERYLAWMENVRPLHLVRKSPVKLIITARLEKYRPQTLAWMERWGVRAKELRMGPWRSLAERRASDVAAWKATELKEFLSRRSGIRPRFYIESDPHQARRIADITGQLTVCPSARKCFGKAT